MGHAVAHIEIVEGYIILLQGAALELGGGGGAATSIISKIGGSSVRGAPPNGKEAAPMSNIAEHDSQMDGICQQEGGTSAKGTAPICQRAVPASKVASIRERGGLLSVTGAEPLSDSMGGSCREGGTYKQGGGTC